MTLSVWDQPPIKIDHAKILSDLQKLSKVLPKEIVKALARLESKTQMNLLEIYVALGRRPVGQSVLATHKK